MSRSAAQSSRWRPQFSTSSTLARRLAQFENLQPRGDSRCGSQGKGAACDFDSLKSCCSQYGYCGNSSEFCQVSQGCQSGCISTSSPSNGRCGTAFGDALCQDGCCSKDGYCGSTDDYCLVGNGCQNGCNLTIGNNGTSVSTDTWTFPSRAAKIGLITGGAVFGLTLILIGLYMVWKCRRQRQKTLDLDTDFESDITSISGPVPSFVATANPGLNRVCMGCSQTKSILAAFPLRRITTGCNHEPGFCCRCLEMSINVSLAQDGWEQVRCPENGCNARLEEGDVQEFASLDDVQRYLARRRRTETRECQICVTDKTVATEFPNRPVTDRCLHQHACKECIVSTIRAAIDEGRWANIICPLCPNQLEFKDIAEFAAIEDFTRYDRLSTRRAMEQIPNFRWCLRDGCDSGQIHAPGEQLMLCNACGYKMCYIHQRPWHSGLTCQEFDEQNARRLIVEEAAVRAVIQRTTRPCPNCRVNVEKVEGTCNHMTCRPPVGCGHEFCYECFVNWTGHGKRTMHKRTCGSYIAS